MAILVVGNGFDVAHKLPTKYSHFLQFADFMKEFTGANFEDLQRRVKDISFLNTTNVTQVYNEAIELGWETLFIKENLWAVYFKDKSEIGENWVDFEEEISNSVQAFEFWLQSEKKYKWIDRKSVAYSQEARDIDREFKNTLKKLVSPKLSLENYKADITKWEIALDKLISHLEIYLAIVENHLDDTKKLSFISEKNIEKVISFNYTDIYTRIYKPNPSCEVQYIHGKIRSGKERELRENDMVVGIEEYLSETEKSENLNFIYFKKYFQRIYKKTGTAYKTWVKAKTFGFEGDSRDVYIVGHSLALTDKDIIKELIENAEKTIIYYFNNDTHRKQISNLIATITQKTLIEKVANGTVIFEEQPEKFVDDDIV